MDLRNIIKEYLFCEKYNLSNQEMIWINAYIYSSPKSLKLVTYGINNIIKDGKIDIHDIPTIINMIATIYHTESIKNETVNQDNIITFVKFTLNIIIDSKFLLLPEIEKEIIEKIINSSLDLLKLNLNTIKHESVSCFNILWSINLLNLFF